MTDEYTPTTEEVRFAYIDRKGFILQTFGSEADDDQAASTEFDRWLASVKAEAWEEAHPMSREGVVQNAILDAGAHEMKRVIVWQNGLGERKYQPILPDGRAAWTHPHVPIMWAVEQPDNTTPYMRRTYLEAEDYSQAAYTKELEEDWRRVDG